MTATLIIAAGSEPAVTITLGAFIILGFLAAGFLVYLIYLKEFKNKNK